MTEATQKLERAIALELDETEWDAPSYGRARAAFLEVGGETALLALEAALEDERAQAVVVALRLLGELEADSAVLQERVLPLIIAHIDDEDLDVATAAVMALAALGRGVTWDAAILRRGAADDDDVLRFAVASALSDGRCDENDEAVRLMLFLGVDPDEDVRYQAVVGLGVDSSADSDAVRELLASTAAKDDLEIAGAAILGLANRGDARALALVRAALEAPEVTSEAIEAAGVLGDSSLVPALEALRRDWADEAEAIDAALAACR